LLPGVPPRPLRLSPAAGRLSARAVLYSCPSPHPAALVDVEGGSIVVAPARILRTSTPGLLPEVLASDINAMPADARAWKAWPVRQVPPTERLALADALAAIERQRTSALKRVALLGELKQLVMRGVTSGSHSLTADIDSMEGN